jgi:hypothetical protein
VNHTQTNLGRPHARESAPVTLSNGPTLFALIAIWECSNGKASTVSLGLCMISFPVSVIRVRHLTPQNVRVNRSRATH